MNNGNRGPQRTPGYGFGQRPIPQAYQQQNAQGQQPYQQGMQQPNYSAVNQAPYQQGYHPQTQRKETQRQSVVQPQAVPQTTFYGQVSQQTGYQQLQQGQPYPGYPQQPYPGYPQQPPQSPRPREPFDPTVILWVMLCGVLPILFVLGMVLGSVTAIKWVFVGMTLATVGALWIKPALPSNLRMTFTGVYGALAVVALVSALTAAPVADQTTGQQGSVPASGTMSQQQPAVSGDLGGWVTDVPSVVTPTPAPDGLQSAAVDQLESFFYFWSVNNQDNMLSLCAPSWRKSVSEPSKELFSILGIRVPVEYTMDKISGTENDTSRTVTVTTSIDKLNGNAPEKYRYQVIMLKEDGQWYVNPASLKSNEKTSTPTPAANPTATPTPEFIATPNTVLYYNTNGGERYHLDAYCKSANEKFLPFKGQFTYQELSTNPAYAELVACNVCGAPLRPSTY